MLAVRLLGGRVVIEFHEVLDTAEARLWFARPYVATIARLLTGLADAYVIHSESDRAALERSYDIGRRLVAVIPHGPYDHVEIAVSPLREAPPDVCNILFFGTIRPYKGLDDLVAAFNALSEEEARSFWLTIVGETWEGHDAPIRLIAESPHRRHMTLINRYVSDEEVAQWFAGADAVALPYRRSSASGPLHVTMSLGLPVLATSVGGLIEATTGYQGAILVPPGAPDEIRRALPRLASLRGQRFSDSHSWSTSVTRYRALLAGLERSAG
jgi:glycosyltransferase involved in cell wall biosynthesis